MKFRAFGYDASGRVVLKSVVYEDKGRAEFWAGRFAKNIDCVVKSETKEVKR